MIWAEDIVSMVENNDRKKSSKQAECLIKKKGFDIRTNALELKKIYEQEGK